MQKFSQLVTFSVLPGKSKDLINILIKAAKEVEKLPGCNQYTVLKDTQQENKIHVFEIWDNKEDQSNSLKSDIAKELIPQAIPLLSAQPQTLTMYTT